MYNSEETRNNSFCTLRSRHLNSGSSLHNRDLSARLMIECSYNQHVDHIAYTSRGYGFVDFEFERDANIALKTLQTCGVHTTFAKVKKHTVVFTTATGKEIAHASSDTILVKQFCLYVCNAE